MDGPLPIDQSYRSAKLSGRRIVRSTQGIRGSASAGICWQIEREYAR